MIQKTSGFIICNPLPYDNKKGIFMSSSLFIQTLTTLRPAAVAKIQGDTANPVRGYDTFYNNYTFLGFGIVFVSRKS